MINLSERAFFFMEYSYTNRSRHKVKRKARMKTPKRLQVIRIKTFSEWQQVDSICRQKIPFSQRIDLLQDFLLTCNSEDT